jgi:FixJ family two-component response regulator
MLSGVQVMKMMVEKYGDVFTFVICTGLSQQEAGELSHETGAAGFLCKPYKAAAVLELLRDFTA